MGLTLSLSDELCFEEDWLTEGNAMAIEQAQGNLNQVSVGSVTLGLLEAEAKGQVEGLLTLNLRDNRDIVYDDFR